MRSPIPLFALFSSLTVFLTSTASTEDIVIGDTTDFFAFPDLFAPGDRLLFEGAVEAFEARDAVFLILPSDGLEVIFQNTSSVISDFGTGVSMSGESGESLDIFNFPGQFILTDEEPQGEPVPNSLTFAGSITALNGVGVSHQGPFSGSITQSGTILSAGPGMYFGNNVQGGLYFGGGMYSDSEFEGDMDFETGFEGDFSNSGSITSEFDSALYFGDDFTGTLTNSGTLSGGGTNAVYFDYGFEGDFINSGTIKTMPFSDGPLVHSPGNEGFGILQIQDGGFPFEGGFLSEGPPPAVIYFWDPFVGNFTNSGLIQGAGGVNFDYGLFGNFTNSGTIESSSNFGVQFYGFEGDFVNSGTITRLDPELPPGDDFLIEDGLSPITPVFDGGFIGIEPEFGYPGSLEFGAIFMDGFLGNFLNTGTIEAEMAAVAFDGSFEGVFENSGTLRNLDPLDSFELFLTDEVLPEENFGKPFFLGIPRSGVAFLGDVTGTVLNSGTISGIDMGVFAPSDFDGTFLNSGLILGDIHGAGFFNQFQGTLNNSGRIAALNDAALYFSSLSGELTNTGVIDSVNGPAIIAGKATGTIRNNGGRISGVGNSIQLGSGDGKVVLSGSSVVNGVIDGGDGSNDILRFENIRGVSQEKKAELESLAAADSSGNTSVVLFGETYSWTGFEDVQVDVTSIESFETLFSSTEFQEYGAALDNVEGLGEEMRVFLNALNELDEDDLKIVAANSSGQTVAAAAENYVRSQGSEVFSLFSAEFSNLRAGSGGGGTSTASNQRTGLFTREIQVGVTINEPVEDDSHIFVTGYVGRGTQDPDVNRTESSVDSTSVMFGRSEALTERWRVGLWGGYTDNDANVDSFGSELRSEAGLIGASATYQGDFGFTNLVLGYGFYDQTTVRRDFLGNRMDGDAVGHQGLFHGQFGRDFYFGEENNTQVSPYLGFSLSRLSMGGYTETGPATTALRFDSQTTDSIQSVVGINVSQYHETRSGWIKPKVDAAWWHEFADANSLGVSLAAAGLLNPFQIDGSISNRDRAIVQVGMELGFDQWENVTFDASYFGTYGGDGYTSHGGALSAEFEF